MGLNPTTTLLRNARVISPQAKTESADLLIKGSQIDGIYPSSNSLTAADTVFDLAGLTLFPGFVDVHIHGAVRVDTMAATGKDLERVSQFLAQQGVTGWLPTLVPASTKQY